MAKVSCANSLWNVESRYELCQKAIALQRALMAGFIYK
jgi:hypothetical protein